MNTPLSMVPRDTAKEVQDIILGRNYKHTANLTVERMEEIFKDLTKIEEGTCNLFHDPCPFCARTKKSATAIRSFMLLVYHTPSALKRDENMPISTEYYRLRDTANNIFHKLWEQYCNDSLSQTNIMPRNLEIILTNNIMESLYDMTDYLIMPDQAPTFFQNRTPKCLTA